MRDKQLKATVEFVIDREMIEKLKESTECNLKVKASCTDKTNVKVEILNTDDEQPNLDILSKQGNSNSQFADYLYKCLINYQEQMSKSNTKSSKSDC